MSIFVQNLKQKGYLDNLHFTVVNVGSRKLGIQDDYSSQGWGIFAPNLTIYGFDADADACEQANAELQARNINWQESHIPIALSDSIGEKELYVTKAPMCSSLYPPDEKLLARFPSLPKLVNLDFSLDIETTTLDTFCQEENIKEIDFLQVDVQGADLNVLHGATDLLKKTILAIQIEVEFSPLYINQPLFADVDTFLRQQKFSLFDLASSYRARNSLNRNSRNHPHGQLLWADAFYLRDLILDQFTEEERKPEKILKLACVADVMGFSDYALELLIYLTVNHGKNEQYNFADVIFESLSQLSSFSSIINQIKDYLSDKGVLKNVPINTTQNVTKTISPINVFHSPHYHRHNNRRQEHLASLGLDLSNKSVLEVGAGIGDHTTFFLDRRCKIVVTEGRRENLNILYSRYPNLPVMFLDMDSPKLASDEFDKFDIIYCYGLLYHLKNPTEAITFMANHCQNLLLLETCVSFGNEEAINPCSEPAESASQAVSGQGCRPTRIWVFNQLKKYFDFVYMPITQPNHEEFPLDWSSEPQNNTLTRSVFIASKTQLDNPLLIEEIPMTQQRH